MAIDLSPSQFHLPGMSEGEIASAHPQNHRDNDEFLPTDKEHAEYLGGRIKRLERETSAGPVKDNWSGPDPHQRIMGVRDLAENNGQLDEHGFVHEPNPKFLNNPLVNRAGADYKSADDRIGDVTRAKDFYRTVGGSHAHKEHVQDHWSKQPVHDIPSSAPIHTGQYWDLETEKGHDRLGLSPEVPEGRQRINSIRGSMEKSGFDREQAPWLVKHNNRLYALDGHHRIVAAREAGLQSFPARVWDRDAERAALKPGRAKPGPKVSFQK